MNNKTFKFNVLVWDGKEWKYLATTTAQNEQQAAISVAREFNLKGRFSSHPHMDTYNGEKTSNTAFTVIN